MQFFTAGEGVLGDRAPLGQGWQETKLALAGTAVQWKEKAAHTEGDFVIGLGVVGLDLHYP